MDKYYASLVDGVLPAIIGVALFLAGMMLAHRLLSRHYGAKPGSRMSVQVWMLGLGFVGVFLLLIALPMGDALRGQIFSFLGILLSAIIALSSTTFVGNVMAGFMLRTLSSFRIGDFIQVADHFGRVSERGLLHIEIQTEDRDLTTLPNLFLVTNPVKVVHAEGTVVSALVSLGYDVPRTSIETCLLQAASDAGLDEAFVQVTELGDFSVVFRIAGMLREPKQLLSARSRLRTAMLDQLHAAQIEIVSPGFMNQRVLKDNHAFIPAQVRAGNVPAEASADPEKILFDKADEAESTERVQQRIEKFNQEILALKKSAKETKEETSRAELLGQIDTLTRKRDRFVDILGQREEDNK